MQQPPMPPMPLPMLMGCFGKGPLPVIMSTPPMLRMPMPTMGLATNWQLLELMTMPPMQPWPVPIVGAVVGATIGVAFSMHGGGPRGCIGCSPLSRAYSR
eukprot:6811218-Pyramimonas_sp.AAC.1